MVLPDRATRRLELTDDIFHECRLTRAVRTDDGDATAEIHSSVHAAQDLIVWVRKTQVLKTRDDLRLALDAIQWPGIGEHDCRRTRLLTRGAR